MQLGTGHQVVVFDLDTTDLRAEAKIVQVAACLLSDSSISFDKYVLPTIAVSESASAITGITTQLASGHKVLRHNGKKVDSLPWEEAEKEFADWLALHDTGGGVMLTAHNCTFDARVLLTNASPILLQHVAGFCNTQYAYPKAFPGLASYSMSSLSSKLAPDIYFNAHDANEDVRMLATVIVKAELASSTLLECSETLDSFSKRRQHRIDSKVRAAAFETAVREGALSNRMAQKAADSGLCWRHIRLVFRRGNFAGVASLLQNKSSGQVRVTNQR